MGIPWGMIGQGALALHGGQFKGQKVGYGDVLGGNNQGVGGGMGGGGGFGNWGVTDKGPYAGMWGGKYAPMMQMGAGVLGGFMEGNREEKQRDWERKKYEEEIEREEERRRRMTASWNSAIGSMGG